MRIESLEYFLMVERCKSFTKAASNLFISPQGLQRAISALEAETSLHLFQKEGRFVVPTEEGRIFSAFAHDVVKRTNEFKAEVFLMQEDDDSPLSNLRLLAMPYASTQFFDVMGESISKQRLDTCIVDEITLHELFELLQDGLNDELVMFALPTEYLNQIRELPTVDIVPLCRMELMVTGSRKLLSPKKASLSIKELSEFPIAFYNDSILDYYVNRMSRVKQGIVQHSSNVERILALVRDGKAVTFSDTLTNYVVEKQKEAPSDVISLPIRPLSNIYLGFVISKDLPQDSIQREAISRFQDVLESECGPYLKRYSWTA